jgi:hypothetical protein
VWAPGTSFIAPDYFEPVLVHKTVGFWEHVLHPNGRKDSRFVEDPSLAVLNIGDFPGAYGDLRQKTPSRIPQAMVDSFRALQPAPESTALPAQSNSACTAGRNSQGS